MEIEATDAIYIPIILGIVEAAKRVGLNAAYAPILSIVLGVAFSLLTQGLSVPSAMLGISWGLMASGLYSGAKTVGKAIS